MDKIKETLTRKIGPLPAWAWGVMVGGGIWVWRAFAGTTLGPTDELSQTIDNGSSGLVPSGSGGYYGPTGVPPEPSASYGIPGGDASPLYVSTPSGAYVEGDSASVLSVIERLFSLPSAPSPVGTPVYEAPAPTMAPAPAPTLIYASSYSARTPGNIRTLFQKWPECFIGTPEYWVNAVLGIGIPGQTAAQPSEWPNYDRAFQCAVASGGK